MESNIGTLITSIILGNCHKLTYQQFIMIQICWLCVRIKVINIFAEFVYAFTWGCVYTQILCVCVYLQKSNIFIFYCSSVKLTNLQHRFKASINFDLCVTRNENYSVNLTLIIYTILLLISFLKYNLS